MRKGFLKAGHLPTLFAAFLYFDLSFMVWVLLGPLGVAISKQLHLDPAHKGLMVATPVLAGAALRVLLGVLVDRYQAKRVAMGAQVVVIAGLLTAWGVGIDSFGATLLLGCVLGLAGASFAVALPLASGWYPPEHQGTALGIAGAGNSGTVLAALFAPGLAIAFGWQNVIGLAAIPLTATLVVFTLIAKDSPNPSAPKSFAAYMDLLKVPDAWWFMFFYSVTFGGFVGLASSLTIYFNDQYGLPPITTASRLPSRAAASIVSTSAISRKETTPGNSRPGTGTITGLEPVAISSTSYERTVPLAPVTVRFSRSMPTAGSPAISSMSFCSYHERSWVTIASNRFSPASTGESMMRS